MALGNFLKDAVKDSQDGKNDHIWQSMKAIEVTIADFEKVGEGDDAQYVVSENLFNAIQTVQVSKELFDKIDIDDVFYATRSDFDRSRLYIDELKESISNSRLIHDISLQEKAGGNYKIILGYRRTIAISELIREGVIPLGKVVLYPNAFPSEILRKMAIEENTNRVELHKMEMALDVKKDSEIYGKEKAMKIHGINGQSLFYKFIKKADSMTELGMEDLADVGLKKSLAIAKIATLLAEEEFPRYMKKDSDALVDLILDLGSDFHIEYLNDLSKESLLKVLTPLLRNKHARNLKDLSLSELKSKLNQLKLDTKEHYNLSLNKKESFLKIKTPTELERACLSKFKEILSQCDEELIKQLVVSMDNLIEAKNNPGMSEEEALNKMMDEMFGKE